MGDSPVRYRFGDAARVGVLLGMGMRQAAPITVGVLWLTLWLMAQMPIVGLVGLMAGVVIAFGRWRRAPLYEVAVPGVRLVVARCRRRTRWHKADLLAAGPGLDGDVPPALRGLQLLETEIAWPVGTRQVGVVVDRSAGTVSMLVPVAGERFPVASPGEQDRLVASWGTALAPFARARCPVSRVTWQEWFTPVPGGRPSRLRCRAAPVEPARRRGRRLRMPPRRTRAIHDGARGDRDRHGRTSTGSHPRRHRRGN